MTKIVLKTLPRVERGGVWRWLGFQVWYSLEVGVLGAEGGLDSGGAQGHGGSGVLMCQNIKIWTPQSPKNAERTAMGDLNTPTRYIGKVDEILTGTCL